MPLLPAAVACLTAAGLSLLLPSVPTTDSWGWIVWGREVAHLDLSTKVAGAPSWKPLPVVFTTAFSAFGDAAPPLWLLAARAGGLMSLVFAFRLGTRLAGPAAGGLGALGLALSEGWARALAHGYTEPAVVALVLAAVESHLDDRRGRAFALGVVAALGRPELWLFLVAYGVLVWPRSPRWRLGVTLGLVAVPALWVVPDWIGSHDPLHGSKVARVVTEAGPTTALSVLGESLSGVLVPFCALAVAGTALAIRRGDRLQPRLAACAGGALALLFALMVAGAPGSARFFAPATSLVVVLGAAGAVEAVRAAAPGRPRVAVGTVAGALLAVFAAAAALALWDEMRHVEARAELQAGLRRAVEQLGGARLRRCGKPMLPIGLTWTKGVVAWELGLHLRDVRGVRHSAGPYVESLQYAGAPQTPTRPAAGPVRIGPIRRRRSLIFAPFGRARVLVRGVPRRSVGRLDLGPRWQVTAVDRGSGVPACGPARLSLRG